MKEKPFVEYKNEIDKLTSPCYNYDTLIGINARLEVLHPCSFAGV